MRTSEYSDEEVRVEKVRRISRDRGSKLLRTAEYISLHTVDFFKLWSLVLVLAKMDICILAKKYYLQIQ